MFNKDLQTQIDYLESMLAKSSTIAEILKRAPDLHLQNWYVGAGAVVQTVWNELHGFELTRGIEDCDLVYFDTDTRYEAEDRYIREGRALFQDLRIEVEIRNEARVHLWYEEKFGERIKPYISVEDAINTWPTTATSVGVRYSNGKFQVYAPYGLHDLLAMIVRPNKALVSQEVYEKKAERWQKVWPKLKIITWDAT